MPTYLYHCEQCGEQTEGQFPMNARPEQLPCSTEGCRSVASYRIAAPALMQASYPDGTKRFTDFKEAAKLQREHAQTGNKKKRQEIASEIRKMGVRISQEN